MSYADIYHSALRVLGALQARGLGAGNELVIQTDNNREFVCLFWASLLGRIIPVPLSGGVQADQKLKFFKVWEYLSAPYLACDEKQVERLQSIAAEQGKESAAAEMSDRYLSMNELFSSTFEGREEEASPHDIAYIQFSSGSTGEPKGVCLTHENLVANVSDIGASLEIEDSDRLLNWMPLTHDMGIIGFHLLGVCRAIEAISLSTSLFIRRPLLWMDLVSSHRATVLYSPNFGFQYFLSSFQKSSSPGWDLSSIRIIVNGAEPISLRICRSFTDALAVFGMRENAIVAAYGLAEASVEVSAMKPGTPIRSYFLDRSSLNIGNEVELLEEGSPQAAEFVDVGPPVSFCQVRICDSEDKLLSEKMIGHIQVRGKNVTSGYYNNPAATKAIFTEDGWLKTGDLGFLINESLVVTGRFKNIIIISGQNYYPQDIERAVTDSGISEQGKIVACGAPGNGKDREKLVVFVLHKGSREEFAGIAAAVREAVQKIIGITVDDVAQVAKIPKTTSGKIRHFQLLEQYMHRQGVRQETPEEAVPAIAFNAAKLEELLVRETRLVLGRDIDANTDLFEAGIYSLAAMQLADRISRLTGRAVSIEAIFSHPSPAALAQFLLSAGEAQQLLPLRMTAPAPECGLSLSQQRILGEYYLDKNSAAYNIPVVYSIGGKFDAELFRHSLSALVKRHEILRTSFASVDGEPRQKIHEYSDALFSIQQVSPANAADMISEEINRPFELEAPSQFRVSIMETGADARLLVFVIHHILVDGWSLENLFRELCTIYNRQKEEESHSAAQTFQFRDYVSWQKEALASEALRRQKEYWLKELESLPEPTDLSTVKELSGFSEAIETGHYCHSFDPTTVRELEQLSAKYKSSLFSLLMSLLDLLAYRYTGQKDITIGFDSTGRVLREMEQVTGYMLNTLCLRTAMDPEQSFSGLVAGVHRRISLALDNQLYPFELLLQDVKKNEGSLGNPMFRMMVLFQNFYHNESLHFEGCSLKKEKTFVQHGFVDLLLEFDQLEGGLELHVQYNRARYGQEEIRRLVRHLENLAGAVAADDALQVAHYDFLTGDEKGLLLPPAAPGKPFNLPVHRLFEERAQATPDAIAVRSGSTVLTYGELNRRANILAHQLIKLGVSKEDRIGFMTGADEKAIIALLGILKSGGAYVAIDPALPQNRWLQMAEDSGMKYCVAAGETIDQLNAAFTPDFLLPLDDNIFNDGHPENPTGVTTAGDLAYVIYTSGSTGTPKGVMIEHGSLSAYVANFIGHFNVASNDIVLQQSSVSFDTIIEEVFPALCTSAQIVIAPQGGRDIEEMMSLIKEHGVTVLSTTPLVLNEINSRADESIASLRLIISGGDVLHPFHINRLFGNVLLYNTYGPSEATVCATYHHVTRLEDCGLIGRPAGSSFIYILDENRQLVPVGRTGEIYIEGGLARGYIGQPQLTEEKFVAHPFRAGERLYRSGDLGRIREDGLIEFLGRSDLQVKVRGHRVEPGEIEKTICLYPAVELAAVVPDKESSYLVAFITTNEKYSEDALRLFLSSHLPYYMMPHRFEVIEQMPLTTSGKINRSLLSAETQQGGGIREFRAPEGWLQSRLSLIIGEALGLERLDIDANLFSHGCNSIKAATITGQVRKEMGYELSVRDLFMYPTIALLSGRMEQMTASAAQDIQPVQNASSYELSPGQKRLWILSEIDRNSFAYNEGEIYRITGHLDPEAARQAFELIAARHEILRTTFLQPEGEPAQVVHEVLPVNFTYDDLSLHAHAEDHAFELLEKQVFAPFDLRKGPLYRIMLLKVGEGEYLFTMVMHHIITDDWSAGIIMREFGAIYQSLLNGSSNRLAAPSLQYRDYAYWVNRNLNEGRMQAHRDHWMGLFREPAPVLDIFPDHARPAIKQHEGAAVFLELNESRTAKIKSFCREQEVSLFMFLLSGVYILLNRYSGQEDIVIGTPVADREHPALKDMPGFFINTLPLRIQCPDNSSVAGVLEKVKETCLEAYAHQSYPLEYLVDALDLSRDLSRSPLFDVLINLSSPDLPLSLPAGMTIEKAGRKYTGCKYDLEFYFVEEGGRLQLGIVYDTHLFSASRMQRLAGHLENILSLLPAAKETPASRLPYLSQEELNTLLTGFNPPERNFPAGTVTELFLQQVAAGESRTAVCCEGRSLSYGDLKRKAALLANYLVHSGGVQPEDVVCLLLGRSEEIIVSILAVWMAGGTYVPIDPSLPVQRIASLVKSSGARLVLTDSEGMDNCEQVRQHTELQAVCVSDENIYISEELTAATTVRPVAEIAYIIFTSGSTGEPKGVQVPHSAVSNLLWSLKDRVGMEKEDTLLSVSSYTFDISVSEFFLPLVNGACLLIAARDEVLNARLLARLMEQWKPDLMQATPGLWSILVDSGWSGSPGLKAITCGEPLGHDLRVKLLQRTASLWNFYGPTETTIFSSGTRISGSEEPVTIGKPMDNTYLYVLDAHRQPVPAGVHGQLYIGGRGVALGYLHQPELTAQKFIEGLPFHQGRLYATGDIVRWLPDGTIDYRGRADNQVKIRGFRIELGEIENVLLGYPSVQAAAVLVMDGNGGERMIVAYVVARGDAQASVEDLKTYLRARLPGYMMPAHFIYVDRIPLTVNGKVDRKLLFSFSSGLQQGESKALIPPQTRIEKLLHDIWRQVLGREEISITDNFFDLGGHSLKANQLVNKVYNALSVEILLSDIFTHATIRQLGELIAKLEKEQYDLELI